MDEDNRELKQVEYKLHEDYKKTVYYDDDARFRCPECGEFAAVKHSGKLIGECLECGVDLQFREKSTMFVKKS